MRLHRLSLAFVLMVAQSMGMSQAWAAQSPIPIIYDTDMGGDCDDVAAQFMLHGAAERGEVTLLATMGNVSTDTIAPALDAINAWFGRPDIPVGTLKDPDLTGGWNFTNAIVANYPSRFAEGKNYPDAVTLYRQILAKQPDRSVVVVAVGTMRNLGNLLTSKPDAASPLDGLALIKRKVKSLEVMGGKYPPHASKIGDTDGESNFKIDAVSAALLCETWPTRVVFNGDGGGVCSGRRVAFDMAEHNPLNMAFRCYPNVGLGGDRLSWDPISVLVAIRGAAPWYEVVSGGRNVADATTGVNHWHAGSGTQHSYLVRNEQLPLAHLEAALEDMMVAGKGHPRNLRYNTVYFADTGMCDVTSKAERDRDGMWKDRAAETWIQYRHVDGRKYQVHSYSLFCPAADKAPSRIVLSASNDGVRWTVLDTQKSTTFPADSRQRRFPVRNALKWSMYRLELTASNPAEGIEFGYVELTEDIDCPPKTAVTGISLDAKNVTLAVHGRVTLNATIAPAATFEREITWTSSDPAVAEVRRIGEQIGMVVAKSVGTCVITAAIGGVRQSCALTVTPSTLPAGWKFDEIGTPAIPGAARFSEGVLALTGCGPAMRLFWNRNSDQGVFVSQPVQGETSIAVRLTSLGPNVGGPSYTFDTRPQTIAGLMLRESVTDARARHVIIRVDTGGGVNCAWREKPGEQEDAWWKILPNASFPIHLKLTTASGEVLIHTSSDGKSWGEPVLRQPTHFTDQGHLGMFVCSGNPVASATATFDSLVIGAP